MAKRVLICASVGAVCIAVAACILDYISNYRLRSLAVTIEEPRCYARNLSTVTSSRNSVPVGGTRWDLHVVRSLSTI